MMLGVVLLLMVVALAVFGGTIRRYFGASYEEHPGEPHNLDDY